MICDKNKDKNKNKNILKNDILLYHGSYCVVDKIDLNKSYKNKDFGSGFYLKASKEQAKSFIKLSLKKAKVRKIVDDNITYGYISIYKIKNVENLKIQYFEDCNIEWLHFVLANRGDKKFKSLLKKYGHYDIVVGKIANDRTASTLQGYMGGLFGEVGTKEADELAIKTLMPYKLDEQICIKKKIALKNLEYMGYEKYEVK